MGTRSETIVKDDEGKILVRMYRQYDGYISGHGQDLREAFGHTIIINGIGSEHKGDYANGMGCLAAQLIAHFKETIGGIYIERPYAKRSQDYTYEIMPKKAEHDNTRTKLWVTVYEVNDKIYDGWLIGLGNVSV